MTGLSLDTKRYFIMCHKGKVSTFSFEDQSKSSQFNTPKNVCSICQQPDCWTAAPQEGGSSLYINDMQIDFMFLVVL